MSAAWRLKQAGIETVLFESSPRPGGWVHTTEKDGFLLEWGPHSVLPGSSTLIELAAAVGLTEQWESADSRARRRYIYRSGQPRALPQSPLGIPFSTALSPKGWLRVATEPFRSTAGSPEESVQSFFRRRLGREASEILADAMVAGISGGIPEDLEMESFAPAVAEMEQKYGSLLRGLMGRRRPEGVPFKGTGTLRKGMQSLPEALASELSDTYQGRNTVTDLYRSNDAWSLKVSGAYKGDTDRFDAVILATPAEITARLVRSQSIRLEQLLGSISYASMVLVQIAYDASKCHFKPDGFGFLVPRGQGLQILGSIWSSTVFPWRAPAGKALATVFMGGVRQPALGELRKSDIVEIALADMARVHGSGFVADWSEVGLAPSAIPQQKRGHSRKVAAIRKVCAEIPGVEVVGGFIDGISLENCARSGFQAADRVISGHSSQ